MYDIVKDNKIDKITKDAIVLINRTQKILDDPEELEKARMELSRLIVVVGQFEAYFEHLESKYHSSRKVGEAEFADKLIVAGGRVSDATRLAIIDSGKTRALENKYHYQYRQLRNLRESMNGMCNAIAGRLKSLRREYMDSNIVPRWSNF